MSGRQEEESDKAIWWESRRLMCSRLTKMCSTKRGISAAVRTGARHEVSEKESMPNPESSDGNFVAAGG